MNKKVTCVFLSFAVISLCLFGSSFFLKANAAELKATLGNIVGTAEVIRVGEKGAIPAEEGMELNIGDVVKTGKESFVTVTFMPGTFIEVASDSTLRITQHELDERTSALNTNVDILSGHLSKAILQNLPDAVFTIKQNDFIPLEAEAYHSPEEMPGISIAGPSAGRFFQKEDEGELTAVIGNIVGAVEVIRVGEVQATLVSNGTPLHVGDVLKTGRDSYATLTFLPGVFVEASGNAEVKIVRHERDDRTSTLDTRVDVLSGHLSKAIAKNIPPGSQFEIVLVDIIAEPFTPPVAPVPVTIDPFEEPASES